jgi:hypothetical protein
MKGTERRDMKWIIAAFRAVSSRPPPIKNSPTDAKITASLFRHRQSSQRVAAPEACGLHLV